MFKKPNAPGVPALIRRINAVTVAVAALLCAASPVFAAGGNAAAPAGPSAEKLFDPVASVLTHPRCLNCHQDQRPAQTDASIPHLQQVIRGAHGTGAATMQCAACHQGQNSADGRVPGAAHWHLAPLSMSWQGKTRAQICNQIKDPERNGGRKTPEQVIEHMRIDPLVLWAWNPGNGRSTPSITHEQFLQKLDAWAKAGMPCPGDKSAAK